MKKLLFLTIIALLSFALLSCNDNAEESPTVTVAPESDFEYDYELVTYPDVDKTYEKIVITKYLGTSGTVIIPETIEDKEVMFIGYGAFSYNQNIKKVVLPSNVTTLKTYSFAGSDNLETVVFNDGLVSIGDNAFKNCKALTSVDFPATLKEIGNNSFEGCDSIKNVVIPPKVNYIGIYAFMNSGLESISFNTDKLSLLIEAGAFRGTKIRAITLPESVAEIRRETFKDCSELSSVTFGNKLTTVGDYSFAGCEKLEEIVFPSSFEKISEVFADGAKGLQAVRFEGNAPAITDRRLTLDYVQISPVVYYHEGAEGFGETWNGYKTQVW